MLLHFYKYQGTGNDFIMIDDREQTFNLSREEIAQLCHRRFGVGADGLILLRHEPGYDFRMVYYNADGGEGSMCGNGGRCTVRFANDLGMFSESAHFLAVDGPHKATATPALVSLKMGDVKEVQHHDTYDFLNTGSPHYVTFVDAVDDTDVVGIGQAIRYNEEFGPRGGTNVNFVEVLDENHLKVRTYERGVEDETYSCGTGVTACVLSAHLQHGWSGPVTIETLGGTLQVAFSLAAPDGFCDIYLIGPAVRVFEGTITL